MEMGRQKQYDLVERGFYICRVHREQKRLSRLYPRYGTAQTMGSRMEDEWNESVMHGGASQMR